MPDHVHQTIVEALHDEPDLAVDAARRVAPFDLPIHSRLRIADSAVSQTKPVTGQADLVVLLENEEGGTVFALVVEVQLRPDDDKEWAWPRYWSLVRDRERVPTMILVVAPDEATARWAAGVARAGDPHEWHPYVTLLQGLPRIVDPDEVRARPARAVLCALGHLEDVEVLRALATGITRSSLSGKDAQYYLDVIFSRAPALLKEVLMRPENYEYQSEFARKYYGEGKAEGKAEGRRDALRTVLAARGLPLPAEYERRIEECSDVATLDRWLQRASTVSSLASVFIDG